MVANAGFLCIQEKAPNLTFRAALETITHRKKDASVVFYYPAMKYLTHDLALNEENFDTFSSFVSDTTPAHEEMAFTLAILPGGFLRSWAERDRIRSAHPTVQAFVVDAAQADIAGIGHCHPLRLVGQIDRTLLDDAVDVVPPGIVIQKAIDGQVQFLVEPMQ